MEKTHAFIKKSLLCDGQLGFEHAMPTDFFEKWQLLDSYVKNGFNLVALSLANDESTPEQAIRYLARVLAHIERNSTRYIVAKTVEDILQAKKNNKLALHLMFQGTNPLQQDLDLISLYYQLGIRSMLAVYNIKTYIGDGCIETNDSGLSHFGMKWVEEMNRIGMLVDCSHASHKTSMDILSLSKYPVIFSHCAVHSVYPHSRNLKDDQIRAVAKIGGVIGICGLGVLLGDENARIEKYIEHIQYIANLVGPQYISIGMDHLYFASLFDQFMQSQTVTHPQVYASKVKKAFSSKSLEAGNIVEIIEELLKSGFSEKEIQGIIGENYLRVLRDVWH